MMVWFRIFGIEKLEASLLTVFVLVREGTGFGEIVWTLYHELKNCNARSDRNFRDTIFRSD